MLHEGEAALGDLVRVVSLPAKMKSWKKLRYSVSVRRSPSTSAWTSRDTRSSVGCSRRFSPIFRPYSKTCQAAGVPNGRSRGSMSVGYFSGSGR